MSSVFDEGEATRMEAVNPELTLGSPEGQAGESRLQPQHSTAALCCCAVNSLVNELNGGSRPGGF